jgi:hypothetical protein
MLADQLKLFSKATSYDDSIQQTELFNLKQQWSRFWQFISIWA